jgi:hypothetical protein
MIQNKQTNVLLVFIFEKFEKPMYRWNPTLHELQITRVSDVLLIVRDLGSWHLASVSISAISLCFHLLDSCTVQSKSLTLKALERK